jgi:hypothetical protein
MSPTPKGWFQGFVANLFCYQLFWFCYQIAAAAVTIAIVACTRRQGLGWPLRPLIHRRAFDIF